MPPPSGSVAVSWATKRLFSSTVGAGMAVTVGGVLVGAVALATVKPAKFFAAEPLVRPRSDPSKSRVPVAAVPGTGSCCVRVTVSAITSSWVMAAPPTVALPSMASSSVPADRTWSPNAVACVSRCTPCTLRVRSQAGAGQQRLRAGR